MGEGNLVRRLAREESLLARKRRFAGSPGGWKKYLNKDRLLAFWLQKAGLWRMGRRGFRRIEVTRNEVFLPGLAREWEGFRLLQISDLHLDMDPGLARPLERVLGGLAFDRAVITGDFQDLLLKPHEPVLRIMRRILPLLGAEPLAAPGNHDLASLVVLLEEMGLRFLLNEHVLLQRGGADLAIAGVDDPHGFRGDDLARALRGIPGSVPCILLAHTPEFYRVAGTAAVDFMLSGHTHGGQICLPGGRAIVRNADVPAELFRGSWRMDHLRGYTSRGTGGCGVPVRFFCPPEVVLHTLRSE